MKEYTTLSAAYPELIKDLLQNGIKSAPRGMPIKELCGYQFKLQSIDDSLPLQKSRKLNYRFGILEGLLNVYGHYPKEIILHYNKNLENFLNPQIDNWNGAYAPRIKNSLKSVYEMLKKDSDTRQAVIPIFQTSDMVRALGNKDEASDIPCTLTLQFLIRDGKLNTIATMRSNDVLWGLGYDVNQFVTITRALSSWLQIPTGWYIHQAGSFHSYDERESQLQAILDANEHAFQDMEFGDKSSEAELFADFKHPEWNVDYETTMQQLSELFHHVTLFIKGEEKDPFMQPLKEPFATYLAYLTGEKKISYGKTS